MKKKMFKWHTLTMSAVLVLFVVFAAGSQDPVEDTGGSVTPSGIPSDDLASSNPLITSTTTSVPNFQYTIEKDGTYTIVRLDLTGIQDQETKDWLKLYGTGVADENLWVSVDNKPKGISVENVSDQGSSAKVKTDLVFLVDNSGSMGQEADSVASDIVSWSNNLKNSNLDIQFGCVGYSEYGSVNGGVDISDYSVLDSFLNGRGYRGTKRTMGFSGTNSSLLSSKASSYNTASDECGVEAILFADANYNFRFGANRIYVNFTDEPNQPGGKSQWSVYNFKDQSFWNTSKGTIHSVFSADTTSVSAYENVNYNERPWALSLFTGGTTLFAPSDFRGVTLDKLPVTGAMTNSYIIRFSNINELFDGKDHNIVVTILSKDGKTRASKSFIVNFGTK